jgi:multidrug efflux pump subunit AcrA (membrane-fusion protein)
VGPDDTAVQRYVTLGQVTADNFRVIKDGIGPNDRVVINGLMRTRPGQKVTPQAPGAPPQAGAPQAAK